MTETAIKDCPFGSNIDKRLTLLEDRLLRQQESNDNLIKTLERCSVDNSHKIDKLHDAVNVLSQRLQTDALGTDIKIHKATEDITILLREYYPTKKDLADEIRGLNNAARLVWLTLAACAGVTAWVVDRLVK